MVQRGNHRYLLCGGGCVVTLVDGVGAVNKYIWAPLAQSMFKTVDASNAISDETAVIARVYGGYASGNEIKMFCSVEQSGYPKCWTVTLTKPTTQSIEWTEVSTHHFTFDHQTLLNIQHCGCYDVYFYEKQFLITCNDGKEQMICSFSTGASQFNEHVKCVIINDNLFIFNVNKMYKIDNIKQRLSPQPSTDPSTLAEPTNTVEFTQCVPYANSTPFVVKETLFVVGG